MGKFFCECCGVKIASLAVCSSEVWMDVDVVLNFFDQKTGKRWFRRLLSKGVVCDAGQHVFNLTNYEVVGVSARLLERLRNIRWYMEGDSIYVLDPPLKDGKYVSLGRCDATCCHHCGYVQKRD